MNPMIQLEQFMVIEDIVRAHPDFIAACARRGITDIAKVCVDPWSAGNFGVPGEEGGYLSHTFCWLRMEENENFYAHPIEGINAVVDIKAGKVIRVDDYGAKPIPMAAFNYESQFRTEFREPLKPLDVIQPEGASFTLNGHALAWDKWSLVIGFNAREGLTLHDIRYDNRPIVQRAALAEMVVPYGVPEGGHFRKNVFDIGEYGLGKLTNSLTLGCDCLGNIAYLDVDLNTMTGEIFHIDKAICIHEEDAGILWKHWDFRTNRTEIRRGRKLVVSSIATVGNYEYASYWYFDQAGMIEFEMKATGIINTSACIPGQPTKYGAEVAPGLQGHIHQHAFCARLEMAVDGPGNSIVECNSFAEEDEAKNPYGNAFYQQETILKSELEAARKANQDTHRYWKVINPNKLNHVGKPVGYKLYPEHVLTSSPEAQLPLRHPLQLYRKPSLGHEIRPGGALSRRRIHEPFKRQRRRRGFREGGPSAGKHRSRFVACLWRASPAADRGFSRAALHQHRLQADARGILRPESRHRSAARHQQGQQARQWRRAILLRNLKWRCCNHAPLSCVTARELHYSI